MAITPSDFSKIWASNADTPEYTFSEANYLKGWDFVGNLPPTRAQWNAIQKSTDEKMKYVFDNFGAPLTASTVAGMTMQNRVYVYTGSEVGYTTGDWYYYDEGTSSWVDGGVYNAVAFNTDTTLTIGGAAADAKVTGDYVSLFKSDLYRTTSNLLDFVLDKALWKQGSPHVNQTYSIYYDQKILVTEGQVFYGATIATGISGFRSCVFAYSADDEFIDTTMLAYNSQTGSYTVPSGVAYIYLGFSTNSVSSTITPEQVLALGNVAYAGSEVVTVADFPARYIPSVDSLDKEVYYYDLAGIQTNIGSVRLVSDDDTVEFQDANIKNYRIGTPAVLQYPYSITFRIKAGYKVFFYVKENGASSYVGSGWKGNTYTIPANAKWALTVARNPEDTTIPADVIAFQQAATTSVVLATVKQKIASVEKEKPVIDIYDVNSRYIDRIDSLTQLTRLPMFLIFSDIHGFGQYLKRIGDFHDKNCKSFCKDVLCLGDIVYDKFSDDFTFMTDSDFGKQVLLTIGNHDCYDGTTVGGVSVTDLYNKFFTDVSLWNVVQPTGASTNGYCYYYKDYDNKIRIIVLNEYYWDATQKTWFESVLASAKSADLAVLVAQHQGNYTEAEYEHLTDYAFGTKGYSFIRQTNGYTERRNAVDSFVANGGEFIGWLSGHTHCEQFGTFAVNGRKQFTMTFSNAGNDITSRMKIINYSQDCFYYLAIDTTNKWVYVLTIGQATNKYFHRNLMLMYNYQTQEVVEYY